ncbi:hypothetical protein FGIG_01151 [Fasciola gigantica]|uniref:Uncharacterized protein n=1 Tax=Fasciola gigantica TaxID=46835 RepID=A0A504YPN9_FASGI|nr:hypothetical protein FGIG_01151 [Fasciola gigantica]
MLFACLPSSHCARLLRYGHLHLYATVVSVSGANALPHHDIRIWLENNPDNLNDKPKLILLPVNFVLNTENHGFRIPSISVISHFNELLGKISSAVWKAVYQFYG